MEIGKLNKRISITTYEDFDDGLQITEGAASTRSMFANVVYLSDSERFRAGAVNRVASVRFTIRKVPVSMSGVISYEGQRYAIESIKPASPGFLEITAGLKP